MNCKSEKFKKFQRFGFVVIYGCKEQLGLSLPPKRGNKEDGLLIGCHKRHLPPTVWHRQLFMENICIYDKWYRDQQCLSLWGDWEWAVFFGKLVYLKTPPEKLGTWGSAAWLTTADWSGSLTSFTQHYMVLAHQVYVLWIEGGKTTRICWNTGICL